MLASLLRCSNPSLSSPLLFCALLTTPLASRRPSYYVYSSGYRFFHAPWCSGCLRCGFVCWACKHARHVVGRKSDPAPNLVNVIDRSRCCCGSHPLGFVRLHSPCHWIPLILKMFAAFIIWQLRAIYKRGKPPAASTARARFSLMYGINEKPAFVSFADATDDDSPRKSGLLEPTPYDPYARWQPQIKSVTLPSGVTVPPVAVTHPERSPKVWDELPPTPNSGPSLSPLASPPPAYRVLGLHTIPLPDTPPESEFVDIPPPTPMRRSPGKTVSTPVRESFDLPPVSNPSPRSASFKAITDIHATPTPHRACLASLTSSKLLPRLMAVTTSFDPSRHDELRLRTGDTLRLIREFDDEWCLVQRVGLPNAEKGVVPRFCLSERPRIKD